MDNIVRPEDIPDHVRETIARSLFAACQRFYSDPENMRRFEEWKARKRAEEASA